MTSIRRSVSAFKGEALLWAKDTLDLLLGRNEPMIPPRRLMFDGPRDKEVFKANGQEFLDHYINLCNLQPDEAILDIGCGIGRKTIPLTTYLQPTGEYMGLDVNRVGVDWCNRHIASRFPNFRFQQIDVYSSRYNPTGSQQSHTYVFPFPADRFDFAVLMSVFTHMMPEGVAQYLGETARVLQPGTGRCLISYFLLNPESRDRLAGRKTFPYFPVRYDIHAVQSEEQPEDAVAFDEDYVRDLYRANGLEIVEIYYGSWCGRPSYLSYQDLILARRL